jgi:hypothetical protein
MDPQVPGACSNWQAWYATKSSESVLNVCGRCEFPTSGFTVKLVRKEPQGINPRILLLERVVTPPTGQVAQVVTMQEVSYSEKAARGQFTQVTILPDGPTVPVKDGTAALPAALFRHWVHSREEDAHGREIYRPQGFAFPPSFGRDGFDIRKNGEFIQDDIGPADGVVQTRGHWESRGPSEITVLFRNPDRADYTFVIVGVDDATLAISRDAAAQGGSVGARQTFDGTSREGSLQEALDLAIAAAQAAVAGADGLTEWTLKSVSGRHGGIAGFRDITVTIEAALPGA